MQTIVIDARELRTSSGRYVERLLNYLQEIDHSHIYKVLLKPQDFKTWVPSNPNFTPLPCPYKEFDISEQIGLKRQIASLKPDLVHFTFPQQPILYGGDSITTIHDLTTLRFENPAKNPYVFRLKQWVYGRVIKRAVRKSKAVLAISNFVRSDVAEFAGVPAETITVTLEAADPIEDLSEPILELEGKRFIMYVGRPTPHKNLERLIEAFTSLKEKHPDLLLVLAGKKDANYHRIEESVKQKGINGVLFTGFVSEGQLRWLYEHCAIYAFPSLSEGFGLPGLEAMVHGAPVVSSNATCLPEVYGDAAHYFDPTNVQAMADAIHDVLHDEKLREKLIDAGKKQAGKYSWRRTAEQTLEVYKSVLSK